MGRGEEAEKGDFKFLPFSSLYLAFPRLEQVSSSAWGESEDSGDARFSCSRKGGFVEHRMRFTPQLGQGVGAGGSDAGWQRSSPGSPSLHRASILALNSPQVHLPFASLTVVKYFSSQKSKGLAASTSQYQYKRTLHAHCSLPMLFPPLLTNLSTAGQSTSSLPQPSHNLPYPHTSPYSPASLSGHSATPALRFP